MNLLGSSPDSSRDDYPTLSEAYLECSPDCVKILDAAGKVRFFNRNGLGAMEIDDVASVTGVYWPLLWPAESRHLLEQALADACARGASSFTAMCPTAKGTEKWWDVIVNAVTEANSLRYFIVSRDVTRQHAQHVAEQQDHARLKAILASGSDVLWDIDLAANKVWWSEGMQSVFGYGRDQVGESAEWCHDHIHPDDRERVVASMSDAVRDGDVVWAGEFRYRKADGGYLHVRDRGSIMRDANGKAVRFVGVMQDVTAQKAEVSAQQLLSKELAHRINNTLAIVTGMLHRTRAKAPDLDSFAESFGNRIIAMANATTVLLRSGGLDADLNDLARTQLGPFMQGGALTVAGPAVALDANTAQAVALALNELATNALKYGALSVPDGVVTLHWTVIPRAGGDIVRIEWREAGGPPAAEPTRTGLGSQLIDRGIPGAKVERRFAREGFSCSIALSLDPQ